MLSERKDLCYYLNFDKAIIMIEKKGPQERIHSTILGKINWPTGI